MNRKIEVKIPVPRYVKKFLEKNYRYEKGSIYVRRDETLGILIESFLEKNFTSHPPAEPEGCVVCVKIYQDAKLLHIPPHRLHYLTKILSDEFDEAIRYYCLNGHRMTRNYQPHVIAFLEMYNIDDDDLTVNAALRKLRLYEEKTALKQEKFCDVSAVKTAMCV